MRKTGFGTDGWRGVIADGFTMENVGIVTQAVMSYIKGVQDGGSLCIGYDTRFMSRETAQFAASVAAGNGFKAYLGRRPVTTPMLSHAVVNNRSAGGLMVTASHNPYKYNGIKFKLPAGGSAYPGITAEIENLIGASDVARVSCDNARSCGLISDTDFYGPYSTGLLRTVDTDAIRNGAPDAVFDCMHGVAGLYASRLWEGIGLELKTIRTQPDPFFGGGAPEPVEENLVHLKGEVLEGGYQIGFATDGDGDRLGVMDSKGDLVGAHMILALLARHFCTKKGMTGAIVKTVSTSSLVDRVAADLGLRVIETPVGFKHICELMLKEDVLIGGEENGGLGVKGYMPERDGFLTALLVLDMLAGCGTGIKDLASGMDERYGKLYYRRHDLTPAGGFGPVEFAEFTDGLKRLFGEFGGFGLNRLDGCKAVFDDGSWILFRLSGTEPLVRVYAESGDEARLERLMSRAREALLV